MAINQVVSGAAALTSSATAFSASVPGAGQTFAVASDAGYPASGRFVVQLNRGESDEEKVLISSRSGTTFTVETRGYDGTTAQSHTNPTVNLILPATVVNALIEHADDIESDPHSTKLLNNTRHDTTTRHALGTVIPVSASAPTPIAPDDTGSAGAANAVARSDHRHAITTDTAVSVGTANAEGSAATFARSDHVHDIASGAVDAAALFGAGVVDTAAIADLAVTSGKLAADSVIAGKIADGGVSATAELADAIVTVAKIGFGAPASYTPTFGGIVTPTSVYGQHYTLGRLVFGWAGCSIGSGGVTSTITVSLPSTNDGGFDGLLAARGRASGGSSGSGIGIIVNGESVGKNIVSIGTAEWQNDVPFGWTLNATLRTVFFYVKAA